MIIVGIDPGTHNFGLGIIEVDNGKDLNILSIKPFAINADYLLNECFVPPENNNKTRHNVIVKYLQQFLSRYDDILTIGYEIPHFDNKSPNSYAILMMHIYALIETLESVFKCPIEGYRPTSIKARIGANKKHKGETSKEAVLRCIGECDEMVKHIELDIRSYSDDALDAALIAYHRLCDIRD